MCEIVEYGIYASALPFGKVTLPELLKAIPVTSGSGQHLTFISIVIICDTQNMGSSANPFFI